METMDETNTSIIKFSLNLRPLFVHLLYFKKEVIKIAFLDVHTREQQYLSLIYTNASNNTHSYTHIN